MKIKVTHIESEYIGVFKKLPNGLTYLREWLPAWYREAMTWLTRR